jgi:anti-anti-sigma factor
MTIEKTVENNVCVLALNGAIDSSKSVVLEQAVNQAINEGAHKLLLDCTGLEYTSSAGLRVLLSTAKKLRAAEDRFALCAPNENVSEVLDIAGMSSILKIHPTRKAALSAMSA